MDIWHTVCCDCFHVTLAAVPNSGEHHLYKTQCKSCSRRQRDSCLESRSMDTGFTCLCLKCDGMGYFDLAWKQRSLLFSFSLKKQTLQWKFYIWIYVIMNIGTNIAQIFQHAVLFLINNSMSLRINVVFLSMTCKETRLYSSGSFRYSLLFSFVLNPTAQDTQLSFTFRQEQILNEESPQAYMPP